MPGAWHGLRLGGMPWDRHWTNRSVPVGNAGALEPWQTRKGAGQYWRAGQGWETLTPVRAALSANRHKGRLGGQPAAPYYFTRELNGRAGMRRQTLSKQLGQAL